MLQSAFLLILCKLRSVWSFIQGQDSDTWLLRMKAASHYLQAGSKLGESHSRLHRPGEEWSQGVFLSPQCIAHKLWVVWDLHVVLVLSHVLVVSTNDRDEAVFHRIIQVGKDVYDHLVLPSTKYWISTEHYYIFSCKFKKISNICIKKNTTLHCVDAYSHQWYIAGIMTRRRSTYLSPCMSGSRNSAVWPEH